MPRRPPDNPDDLYQAISKIVTWLRLDKEDGTLSPGAKAALVIGEKLVSAHQDRTLDAVARTPERRLPEPSPASARPAQRTREQLRARLFQRIRPEEILAPANVVAVYLRDHPKWRSWAWPDTAAINARMLPIVQRLDPTLADDPRVALPYTMAGFYACQALRVPPIGPDREEREVDLDSYLEIRHGLSAIDRRLTEAYAAWRRGELSEDFWFDYSFVGDCAQVVVLLQLQAVRHLDALRPLILQCRLGSACRKEEPFYIARPGNTDDRHHQVCRTQRSRQDQRLLVTLIGQPTFFPPAQ